MAVREILSRWFPSLRTRRFDAAAGGRRWQGVQTFGNVNAEVGAAAGPVRRRAGYYAHDRAANLLGVVWSAGGLGLRSWSRGGAVSRCAVARHLPLERAESGVLRSDPVARRIATLQEELAAALAEGDAEVASRVRVELEALALVMGGGGVVAER